MKAVVKNGAITPCNDAANRAFLRPPPDRRRSGGEIHGGSAAGDLENFNEADVKI